MATKEELAQHYKFIGSLINNAGDLDPDEADKLHWKKRNPNWIRWLKGEDTISLDGDFTVEELKEILTFVTGGCIDSRCPFFFKEEVNGNLD